VTEESDTPRPGPGDGERRRTSDPGAPSEERGTAEERETAYERGTAEERETADERETPEERETAYELLQRGHDLLRRRHHAQAAVVLERAARLEPGKGSILEALGRAYYNSAQHERSRETFEALLEIDPSAHYAHYALGQSLKKLGREREAWTHLRLAVALAPSSTLYRAALARIPAPRREDAASS
jgi:tetratricopeptide (TPR) repeat protein